MAEVVVVRRKYHWPEAQLNLWIIIMLAAGATVLGIFAEFITIQNQMQLGIPWIMPYNVTIGALLILFIIMILGLISQRMLLPGIVILGSFILFVLWLTGLIATAIQLFGPSGSVNNNCSLYVTSQPSHGPNINTLAWLQQNNICSCWKAAFSFLVIGCVFLLWMIIMGTQVSRDDYD
ncbi:MAG: hypothetical protein M1835_004997 [Candelina submexicana]|nr:MAG: hypothetical protein M1835_004997 [Candelina submexicana]